MLIPKERFIAALNLEETDRIPMFEYRFHSPEKVTGVPNIANELRPRFLVKGKRLTVIKHNLENEISLCRKVGFDALYVKPTIPLGNFVEENVWMDQKGTRYVLNPETDKVTIIKPEEPIPSQESPKGIYDSIEIAQKLAPELAIVVGGLGTVAPMPTKTDAVEVARRYYIERQDMMREIEKRAVNIIEKINLLADIGAEIFRAGIDDIAGRHGPFLRPRIFNTMIFPYLKKVADAIHKKGAWLIVHTDGNLWPILASLVDTGIDALGQIDPSAGMDIKEVKEKYGDRIALHGNVDCAQTLIYMKPEDVAQETKECIAKASPGGGHILGTSNVVDKATPIENALAMIKTGHNYGRYPLRL